MSERINWLPRPVCQLLRLRRKDASTSRNRQRSVAFDDGVQDDEDEDARRRNGYLYVFVLILYPFIWLIRRIRMLMFPRMNGVPVRRSDRIRDNTEGRESEDEQKSRMKQADSLKSPTSPKAPVSSSELWPEPKFAPPRPLLAAHPAPKKLILDLDETLIHSHAKGSRLSTGHMVEVKFDQHAILYSVYKRPHCERFLRKVWT